MHPPTKRFEQRHWIWGICYVLAGALLSVVVAWTAVALGPNRVLTTANMGAVERDGLHLLIQSSREAGWATVRFLAFPDEAQARWATSHQGREEIATPTVPAWALSSLDSAATRLPPAASTSGATIAVSAIGWPFISLKGVQTRTTTGVTNDGIIWLGPRFSMFYLPIWPGLLLNTLIFSAAVFAAHWSSRAIIRRRRRAKGRCAGCGYDRRGLTPDAMCPECGAAPTIAATLAT
jgi:hypothetical protein